MNLRLSDRPGLITNSRLVTANQTIRRLRTRPRLVGLCAVLLLLLLLFWLDPFRAPYPERLPSVSTLIRALQKKDSRLNQFEVAFWNRLPAAVRDHCRSLRPALARETRHEACLLLAQYGPKAAKATPFLITALDDPVGWVRVAAVHALGAIGPPANAAKTALIAILRDPAYRSPTNQLDDDARLGRHGPGGNSPARPGGCRGAPRAHGFPRGIRLARRDRVLS